MHTLRFEIRGYEVLVILFLLVGLVACRGQPTAPEGAGESGGNEEPESGSPIEPGQPGAPMVEEEEVGLPVYPGLERVTRTSGGELEGGEVRLPAIVGHTTDSMDDVVAFYAENLDGWNRMEAHGSEVFWKGDPADGYDPMTSDAMTKPSVTVMPPLREGAPVRVQYVYEK